MHCALRFWCIIITNTGIFMLRYTYLFIFCVCLFCLLFNGSVYLRVCAFNLDGYCCEATIKLNSDSVSILPDSAFRFILDFCLFCPFSLLPFCAVHCSRPPPRCFTKLLFDILYVACVCVYIWNVTVTFSVSCLHGSMNEEMHKKNVYTKRWE